MNKIYLATSITYVLPLEKTQEKTYQTNVEIPTNLIWLNSLNRSTDVPPANHKSWRDLNQLFSELNSILLDEENTSWLSDLRSGSSERINRFYESEDW